jgi:hypothetical protein
VPARARSCSGCAVGPPEAGRAACDDEAPAPLAGHPSAVPSSSLTTSAPVGGSGAGAGRLTHWSQPGGRTSSSGISTTAAWLSSIGAGAGGTDGAVTAMVMAADGLPPPAATLLLQLRYAGPRLLPSPCSQPPAAPSMSAASWGRPRPTSTPWRAQGGARWAPPYEHEDEEIKLPPLEDTTSGGVLAYLRVEKPRFLFLGGSAGVVAAADVATAAPPVASAARAGTSAARAGTSAVRAASLTGCLVTGAPAPAPSAVSSAASAALGEGAQAPTSRGELAPHCSLPPLPRPMTSTPKSPGKIALLLTQPELLTPLLPTLPLPDPLLLLVCRQLLFPPLRRARARAWDVGGSDRAAFTVTSCRE